MSLPGAIEGQLRMLLDKINPLAPMVPLSGLVLNENAFVVESMRNLDAKCEIQRSAYIFCSGCKKNSNNSKLYNVHNGSIYGASRIGNT